MKSIISLMAVASVAFVANATLEDLYKEYCVGEAYTVNGVATTYYQPWEALLGFALGSQVNKDDT